MIYSRTALLIFPLLLLILLSFPVTSWAQRISTQERQTIRQLRTNLDSVRRYLRDQRYEQCVTKMNESRQVIVELAAGAREELATGLKPEYDRWIDLYQQLQAAGQTLEGLATLDELIQAGGPAVSFQSDVAPILNAKCGNCHVDQNRGQFSMATFNALDRSTMIAYGLPDDSRIVEVIESGDMPRGGLTVAEEELQILKRWIQQGAKFDGDDPNRNLRQLTSANETGNNQGMSVNAPTGKETVSFGLHIAPILVENCAACHMVNNPRGNFNQTSFQNLLRGGDSGSPWVAGKPDESRLYSLVASGAMPPRGKLADEQIALIRTWISEGASFDGRDPSQRLSTVAAVAQAAALSHRELSDERNSLALKNWKLVMGNAEPSIVPADNFRLVGLSNEDRLPAIAETLEKQVDAIAKTLNADQQQPLVKGGINLFVLQRRYDFSELGRMVASRELPQEMGSHWEYTTVDAFGALLLTRNQSAEDARMKIIQMSAALHVAALDPDVPRWFADGVGYWVAAKIFPRDPLVKQWDAEIATALESVKNSADLFQDRIDVYPAGLLGYQFVKQLKRKSRNFDQLLDLMRRGSYFEFAFQQAYGTTPDKLW